MNDTKKLYIATVLGLCGGGRFSSDYGPIHTDVIAYS